ncbi:MAG: DUF2357 domain-containing protein [Oscillospiraceae bacterium]|nr:DUF2357 domain-containing protein [Oscillospiraceae bacterium]
MANTLNDLYLKYVNKVGATVEKDRYFQYLFAMTQAGNNVLHQTSKTLHKVVDEEWLTTIEDSLDSINKIIANPRRFVATSEQVVPVALAKKITADSVRHLSQNTQFIASNEDGDVHPTRILNVTTEDSYDLYENRFIYHLIQRLVTFIDKRTDLIFWSTGDETMNTLTMESDVDDAYETIEYRMEMRIKNRQSFAENDSDNMNVFMRIDRVRRMVMSLRTSSFCSLLAGCAKVRSPIQRTNLLMKDPDYRNCYKLWQFLERYDSLGYTIEEQDRALEFDEEFLIQLQTNLIANYAVFKSILEADKRDLSEMPPKRRRVIKPKFLKRVEEQIVDDYNIEDVEIRKVIIEEVTQAQLDAEAKLAEETARAEKAERERDEAEERTTEAYSRMQTAIEQMTAAERAAEDAAKARQDAEETMARTVRASRESIQEAEKARIAAEKAAQEYLNEKNDMDAERRMALEAKKRAEEDVVRMEEEVSTVEKQIISERMARENAQEAERRVREGLNELRDALKKAEEEAARYKKQAEESEAARAKAEQEGKQARETAADAVKTAEREEKLRLEAEQRAKESDEAMQKAEAERSKAEKLSSEAVQAAERAKQDMEKAVAQSAADKTALREAESIMKSAMKSRDEEILARIRAEEENADVLHRLEEEKAARSAAEQRAAENTLGKLISNTFGRGRSGR